MLRVRRTLPLAALMLAGCQNQPAALNNPFLSPDRVPPPATRNLAPGTAQPYYPGDPGMGGTAPPYTPAPAGSGSPLPPASPPGGYNAYPQTAPGAASPYAPATSTNQLPPGGTHLAEADASQGDLVRVPEDSGRLRVTGSGGSATQPAGAGTTPTLPKPGPAVAFASTPRPTPHAAESAATAVPQTAKAPAVLTASYESAASDGFRPQGSRQRTDWLDDVSRPALHAPAKAQERFSHDPQYQWLRGQLERDVPTGMWRIRYQRADQTPDQFGGSVLIANPQLLGNLEPGALVVLRGQLHNLHFPDGRTLPAYQLTVVQRQFE